MNNATSQQLYGIPQRPEDPEVQTAQSQLDNKMEKYKTRMAKLGKAEIVLGSTIVILGLVVVINPDRGDHAQGIWCGPFLIASGITGVATHSRLPHQIYIRNMALSMIGAFFMVLLVVYSSRYASFYMEGYNYWGMEDLTVLVIEFILAGLGLIAFIITIAHFVYSCAGACNLSGSTRMSMPVQMSNGQVMLFTSQAAVSSGSENPAMVMPTLPDEEPVISVAVAQSADSNVSPQSADSDVLPQYDRF